MTLPQQLDPFSLEDNPTLAAALRYSNLPYTTIQGKYTQEGITVTRGKHLSVIVRKL